MLLWNATGQLPFVASCYLKTAQETHYWNWSCRHRRRRQLLELWALNLVELRLQNYSRKILKECQRGRETAVVLKLTMITLMSLQHKLLKMNFVQVSLWTESQAQSSDRSLFLCWEIWSPIPRPINQNSRPFFPNCWLFCSSYKKSFLLRLYRHSYSATSSLSPRY